VRADVEFNVFTLLTLVLFKKYLRDKTHLFEFGCGPGHNLHLMARLFPQKRIMGLDWSSSAVKLVNLIGKKHDLKITGRRFDMFKPDYGVEIPRGSAVLTIGCLEQLGARTGAFLRFVRRKKPALCLHIEPIVELYDEDVLLDYLAIRYQTARKYLQGFLPALRRLHARGEIRLKKVHRVPFGGLFYEGWSLIMWKPR
jgi:hypothetical protein